MTVKVEGAWARLLGEGGDEVRGGGLWLSTHSGAYRVLNSRVIPSESLGQRRMVDSTLVFRPSLGPKHCSSGPPTRSSEPQRGRRFSPVAGKRLNRAQSPQGLQQSLELGSRPRLMAGFRDLQEDVSFSLCFACLSLKVA